MVGISWISCKAQQQKSPGFTLLELLTALAVISIAATIFLRLFASSNSLAAASLSHEVAVNFAEEYLTTIQANPERFVWPDYDDAPIGDAHALKPIENGAIEENFSHLPKAMPTTRRAYNRDRNLYNDFTWEAFALLPHEGAQYVQLIVEISWMDEGKLRRFSLGSTAPRAIGDGVS